MRLGLRPGNKGLEPTDITPLHQDNAARGQSAVEWKQSAIECTYSPSLNVENVGLNFTEGLENKRKPYRRIRSDLTILKI